VTALSLAIAFVVGMGADHFAQREAHAQSLSTATLYVPLGGLVFRAPDGTALARISRDAHGGAFELFDDRQEVSMRVPSPGTLAPAPPPNPYVLDKDPWTALHPATRDDPGY
jgi:hypothetical protein